jgi:hypothetical protein
MTGGLGILRFWVWMGAASGNQDDHLRVLIDSTEVYKLQGNAATTSFYQQVERNVGSMFSSGQHTLRFEGFFTGRASSPSGPPAQTNISVDDVSFCSAPAMSATPSGAPVLALAVALLALVALLARRTRRAGVLAAPRGRSS